MKKTIRNILKHPFKIGLPVLAVFSLWGLFAFNVITQYSEIYNRVNPSYPALIIGFLGLLLWVYSSFSDISAPRIIDMTYNSPTSGRMGIPFSYGCWAALALMTSSLANSELTLFVTAQWNNSYVVGASLIAIGIDFSVASINKDKSVDKE